MNAFFEFLKWLIKVSFAAFVVAAAVTVGFIIGLMAKSKKQEEADID